MKKKIALTVASMFLMSSAAFAAPLTDYHAGKASVDLNYRNTKVDGLKAKYNLEPSVTVGVADKWAVQYRNVNAKSKVVDDERVKLSANEFNVLYSLTPQASAFIGHTRTKGTAEIFGVSASESRSSLQLGVLGTMPVAEKVSLYGVLGAGNKYTNFEVGISYAFTENVAFNLDYRDMKAKLPAADLKAKGLGFGMSYKFN